VSKAKHAKHQRQANRTVRSSKVEAIRSSPLAEIQPIALAPVPVARSSKDSQTGGWFKASRFPDMPELVKSSRTAFILAYALAFRARWNDDAFNPFSLDLGEAVCDYENWGLSEQEFRTARDKLIGWSLATFRATAIGRKRVTIGRLVNTRLFSVLASEDSPSINGRRNGGPTDGATVHPTVHPTTYQEQRAKSKERKKGEAPRQLADWQLAKDVERLKRNIQEESNRSGSSELLCGLQEQLEKLRAEQARRGSKSSKRRKPKDDRFLNEMNGHAT
jgi:hypothetical protein